MPFSELNTRFFILSMAGNKLVNAIQYNPAKLSGSFTARYHWLLMVPFILSLMVYNHHH
jgi:hypothetical protein